MPEKCVICDPESTSFNLLCPDHNRAWLQYVKINRISHHEFAPAGVKWVANESRESLKKEIFKILDYWDEESRPDSGMMALHDICELVGYEE
jgi:hypothetical protein